MAFGAALHGWGFTLQQAKQKNLKFSDIMKAYKKGEEKSLQKTLPVYETIFKMAIEKVPNPKMPKLTGLRRFGMGKLDPRSAKHSSNVARMGRRFFASPTYIPT